MSPAYSACLPVRDAAATVGAAVASLRAQEPPPLEVVVVDDGSRDGSGAAAAAAGARVVRHPRPLGRGAARARALVETAGEHVLCCDATNVLAPGFAAAGLAWMAEPRVAAVFGRLRAGWSDRAAERWKHRHLFKAEAPAVVNRRASLATWGALLRRAAVAEAGGFDPARRHSEDADLGDRLLAAGWEVVFDPALGIVSRVRNTGPQVLERHWRWYVGKDQRGPARFVLAQARLGWRIYLPDDLRRRDWGCATLSLALPLAAAWHSATRRP